MTAHTASPYEYDIYVAANEIDEMGHVNNAVYLTWVQAAVLHHWRRLAPKEAVATHLWVALKHEIRYRYPAFLNDHVQIKVLLKKLLGAMIRARAEAARNIRSAAGNNARGWSFHQ